MDNQKQINQMIGFIKAECNEKCQEIAQRSDAEYERRFQELKRDKEQQIQAEFKQKRQNAHVQRLIESSHKKQEINASLIVLRSTLVDQIKVVVIQKLGGIEKNEKYGAFITNLIVQGLISVQEEKIQIRCRKIDEPIVQKVLKAAEDLFKKAVSEATGYTPVLEPLTIDKANYLPDPFKEGAVEWSLGGVQIVARGGKIVCNNTIEARLDLAFKHMLPNIRAYLFGEVPKKVSDGSLPHHLTSF
jgi:V-type H+-transporting ATPase subunit E